MAEVYTCSVNEKDTMEVEEGYASAGNPVMMFQGVVEGLIDSDVWLSLQQVEDLRDQLSGFLRKHGRT